MKKIAVVIIATWALVSCDKKETIDTNGLRIRGKVTEADSGYIVLKEVGDSSVKSLDSVKLKDNAFEFNIKVSEKGFYYLEFFKKQTAFLIGGPGDTLFVATDPNTPTGFTVRGSVDNDQMKRAAELITSYQKEFTTQQQNYMALVQQGKTEEAQQIVTDIEKLYEQKIVEAKKMINEFGSSLPAISLAANFISPERDLPFLDSLAQRVKKDLPNSKYAVNFVKFIEKNKVLNVGSVAPDFTASTPDGAWVKLSDFKGKYVLLDFWASWCKPCRQENPNVVKLFNNYKDKGFTVLSVSLDEIKPDWENAIKKDGLTWTHVSDLKGWQSAIAQQYKVDAIPATYLLDKEGRILAKNLRGEDLEAKLKESMKQ